MQTQRLAGLFIAEVSMIGNYEVICGAKIEHFNNEAPLMNYIKTLAVGSFKIIDKTGNDVTSKFISKPEQSTPKHIEEIITPKKRRFAKDW
jgi:hypothetical protein